MQTSKEETIIDGLACQDQSRQTDPVQPQLPDREEGAKRIQENTWSKGNSKVLERFVHYLYLGFIPGLSFTKYFGLLFNGQPSIFRTWIGPSVYQQPWTVWLKYPNLPPVLGAPYSIFWYGFYWLIAWNTIFASVALISIDLAFTGWIWKKGFRQVLAYQILSILFLTMFPSDLLILWLIILAYKNPVFLVVAPMVKLPVGAPLWVWQWVWFSPYSIHNPENTLRYSLLAVSWIGALLWQTRPQWNRLIFSLLDKFH